MTDEITFKEVWADLRRKKVTNLPYHKYRLKMMERDLAVRKKEFEERRIKTRFSIKELVEN